MYDVLCCEIMKENYSDIIDDIEREISSRTQINSGISKVECSIKPCRQVLLMRYPV
jgi:hypothetical protein